MDYGEAACIVERLLLNIISDRLDIDAFLKVSTERLESIAVSVVSQVDSVGTGLPLIEPRSCNAIVKERSTL